MRWIQKTSEPRELTEWRSKYNTDINFGYELLRQDSLVVTALVAILLKEQGWLCAYTGIGIDENKCHIEHVKPQKHCTPDETVAYGNVVACYPAPNPKRKTPYGAEQKGHWPKDQESHLFVSPLDKTSETRFQFNLRGKVAAANPKDAAATETIKQLGLNDKLLVDLRDGAIKGTLGKNNIISIKDARKRLKFLQAQEGERLDPFWFVLKQALEKHIRRGEYIRASKKQTQFSDRAKRSKK
jgi:uncharacterized protein (TIGR02646 family)